MARLDCECPLNVGGTRQMHDTACPNRKRGVGAHPKDYTGRARVPRTWQHARMAIEHLRGLLGRLAASDINRPLMAPASASLVECRMQVETVRRYLDGE